MAKPLEIKRIDLLVHPFWSIGQNSQEAKHMFGLWKGHIDEVAKDPARLLIIQPLSSGVLTRGLLGYANKQLGKRFAAFDQHDDGIFEQQRKGVFKNGKGKNLRTSRLFPRPTNLVLMQQR